MSKAIICFLILVIGACTSDKKVDSDAVREEIKSRELKKVSESDIISKAYEIGNQIALSAKNTLGQNLQQSMGQGGVEHAIAFCNINAMPLVDSLSQLYGAEIRRVSLKVRNPIDEPNTMQRQLLEAYTYQWKDSVPLQANVQALDDDSYLFTKPILIDNALCLSCHGTPENGMLPKTQEFILGKYPADQATGYNMGDLRGMWSIVLGKKNLVKAFD